MWSELWRLLRCQLRARGRTADAEQDPEGDVSDADDCKQICTDNDSCNFVSHIYNGQCVGFTTCVDLWHAEGSTVWVKDSTNGSNLNAFSMLVSKMAQYP